MVMNMYNLDMASLRAVVAAVDHGGVTRAASILNLTQSAVSMQIKRIEDVLGKAIFVREARKLIPTFDGELCISYARQILRTHDEMYARLTDKEFDGVLVFGVPHDLLNYASQILFEFSQAYPSAEISLVSENTIVLRELLSEKKVDMILTTEFEGEGDELLRVPLHWVGRAGGKAALARPLKIAMSQTCSFRPIAHQALAHVNIEWENPYTNSDVSQSIMLADLAVRIVLDGDVAHGAEIIDKNSLPKLPDCGIYYDHNMGQNEKALKRFRDITLEVFSKMRNS